MTRQYSRSTFVALWVGLGLTVIAIVSAQLGRPIIGGHIRSGYPSISHNEIATGVDFYVTSLTIVGALGLLGWAVTIWSAHRGSRWIRWAAVLLALTGTSVAAFALLVRDTSGDTGLPPLIGTIGLLPCAAGLVAVILMFTRSATSANRNGAPMHRSPQPRTE
ncbi:hypothetical protein [Brevibacterium atlanticum]|uniref:hypothetical protein n=1 Tax=Brevibacterium atlanticum TaxID=2697563 RepID=UPI00141F9E09|nr:hypothetical protein [Brevibacterium atlanticum]